MKRLSTSPRCARSALASFYKYCEQEQVVDRNPALNVRRPKVDYESRTLGPSRWRLAPPGQLERHGRDTVRW